MTKRIAITVSDDVAAKLSKISKDYGVSVSGLGSVAIMDFLEQRKADKKGGKKING